MFSTVTLTSSRLALLKLISCILDTKFLIPLKTQNPEPQEYS